MGTYAIPVLTDVAGSLGGGTAFLYSLGGTMHLVTAAHNCTGATISSTQWDDWSSHFAIFVVNDSHQVEEVRVDLFDEVDGTRSPRFKYVRQPHLAEHVVDLVMIPVDVTWQWVAQYQVASQRTGAIPRDGDMVQLQGFPVHVADWPEIQTVEGPIVHVPYPSPGLLLAAMASAKGFSGGPVFDFSGAFMGMVLGQTDDADKHAQIIPPGMIERAAAHPGGDLLRPTTVVSF